MIAVLTRLDSPTTRATASAVSRGWRVATGTPALVPSLQPGYNKRIRALVPQIVCTMGYRHFVPVVLRRVAAVGLDSGPVWPIPGNARAVPSCRGGGLWAVCQPQRYF